MVEIEKFPTGGKFICFISSLMSSTVISSHFGQDVSTCCSQHGPFHYKQVVLRTLVLTPRDTKSAGFSLKLMWFQSSILFVSCMWYTRFATKFFHLSAGDLNQASTIIESVQNLILLELDYKALDEAWYMSVNNIAEHSSSPARNSLLRGETLDLEQRSFVVTFPWTSIDRMYMNAP